MVDYSFLKWTFLRLESHFHTTKRRHFCQVVAGAQMSNAEHLACDLAQPRAQRNIEALQRRGPEGVRIAPGRQ